MSSSSSSFVIISNLIRNSQEFFFIKFPVGEIAENVVCRRIFLTIWHCILSVELSKNALLQTFGDFSHWVGIEFPFYFFFC